MTQTTALSSFSFFSFGILSFFNNCLQNTKLMNIPHFDIKIALKLLKICKKNGLKIDEFYTHQIPQNLKFFLSPSKEKKILFTLKQFYFYFEGQFSIHSSIEQET